MAIKVEFKFLKSADGWEERNCKRFASARSAKKEIIIIEHTVICSDFNSKTIRPIC